MSREDYFRLADCRHGSTNGRLAVPDKCGYRTSSTDGVPSIQCIFQVCPPKAGRDAPCESPDNVRQRTSKDICIQGIPIVQGISMSARCDKGWADRTGGQTQLGDPCTVRDTATSHQSHQRDQQGHQREHAIASSSANTFIRSDNLAHGSQSSGSALKRAA